VLIVIGRTMIPIPAIIDHHNAQGTIYFSSNRSVVWWSNACVTLRWQVDNIQDVYLNGEAQIGSGEVRDCSLAEAPALRVQFRDNSEQIYSLPILVIAHNPLPAALTGLAIVTALLYRKRLRLVGYQPFRLMVIVGVLVIINVLFIGQSLPLVESAASLDWLKASAALASIFSGLAIMTFVELVIVAHLLQSPPVETESDSGQPNLWVLISIVGAAFTLFIVIGTILAVNPRGMYFTNSYAPHQLILREQKTRGYFQLAAPPDVVIMGSSRAFTLSPAYIHERTGLTAYNMAVEGGRIEDFLIQARQLQPFPRVLLLEVQEGLPREPNDIATRAPISWLPSMRGETAVLTLQKRLEGLIDLNQFAEAVHIANYAELYKRQSEEWPEFDADGFAARIPITAPKLEQAILTDIGNVPPMRCGGVDEISQNEVATLIHLAKAQRSALIFYISPLHPRYYDARLRDEPEYQQCYQTFTTFMSELAQKHDHVFFLDYSRLVYIAGTADETGYFDSQHLTPANSNRLIDQAAAMLLMAYDVTAQRGN
jgi:hypothetical protein